VEEVEVQHMAELGARPKQRVKFSFALGVERSHPRGTLEV
jgi:hypothetical protein